MTPQKLSSKIEYELFILSYPNREHAGKRQDFAFVYGDMESKEYDRVRRELESLHRACQKTGKVKRAYFAFPTTEPLTCFVSIRRMPNRQRPDVELRAVVLPLEQARLHRPEGVFAAVLGVLEADNPVDVFISNRKALDANKSTSLDRSTKVAAALQAGAYYDLPASANDFDVREAYFTALCTLMDQENIRERDFSVSVGLPEGVSTDLDFSFRIAKEAGSEVADSKVPKKEDVTPVAKPSMKLEATLIDLNALPQNRFADALWNATRRLADEANIGIITVGNGTFRVSSSRRKALLAAIAEVDACYDRLDKSSGAYGDTILRSREEFMAWKHTFFQHGEERAFWLQPKVVAGVAVGIAAISLGAIWLRGSPSNSGEPDAKPRTTQTSSEQGPSTVVPSLVPEDLLSRAQGLIGRGKWHSAAMAAGLALELRLKGLARSSDEFDSDKSMDEINVALMDEHRYTQEQAEKVRVWLKRGRQAMDGAYDQYKPEDVQNMVKGIAQFFVDYPESNSF